MNARARCLTTCAAKQLAAERFRCPSCGETRSRLVSRKYLVTALRRCARCELLFRTPTITSTENEAFYQQDYTQGFMTDFPDEATLRELVSTRFAGTEKDYQPYIRMLAALGGKPGDRILDFGCSWGYGSWQFAQAGYEVVSFEISRPRCQYAREKLQVAAYNRLEDITQGNFDIFFSAHVLEHVPSVAETISFARSKLRAGGRFVAFTPNGSDDFRREDPATWDKLWGMVHPNFLDDRFYRKNLPRPFLASTPYDCELIARAISAGGDAGEMPLHGSELMATATLGADEAP